MDALHNACSFTGHRPKYFRIGTNEEHPDCRKIKAFLREKSEYLILYKGVTHFISGGATGVDTWAMEEVIGLRKKHPRITLQCVFPFAGMVERFASPDQKRFARIKPYLDAITTLNERYHSRCMQQRNEFMVDHTQYLIAVWTGQKSGTANTISYAKKCNRTIFCMNPDCDSA